MTEKEIVALYEKYLNRMPNQREIDFHGGKLADDFERELSTCPERMSAIGDGAAKNVRYAMLLCGHLRNHRILEFLKTTDQNIDVFVFAWDNWGHQSIEVSPSDYDPEGIYSELRSIPNIKKLDIKTNRIFLESIMEETHSRTYFDYSSPEVFIKSQLFSINQAYGLFEQHCQQTGDSYDVVMKCRFDCEILKFQMKERTLARCHGGKHIFVTNDGCHKHPYFPNGCMLCNTMYDIGFVHPHLLDHTNIICDFMAYGSPAAMRHYCGLYNIYDDMCDGFLQENMDTMKRMKLHLHRRGNNYRTNHKDSIFYFKCSYPERLLQYHLKDYVVPSSRDIISYWARSAT